MRFGKEILKNFGLEESWEFKKSCYGEIEAVHQFVVSASGAARLPNALSRMQVAVSIIHRRHLFSTPAFVHVLVGGRDIVGSCFIIW